MFEHRSSPLISRQEFYRRQAKSILLGCGLLMPALGIGILGYHFFEHLAWLDAFASAAMILSGMGPLGPLETSAGKLFAGCYALFSGLMFITVSGVVLAPMSHRLLHKFHFENSKKNES